MNLRLAIHSTGIPVIFVVLSLLLLLLLAQLTYSPIFLLRVFAEPPDPCFGDSCARTQCHNHLDKGTAGCCWGVGAGNCQECAVNTQTGEFENCTPVYRHAPVIPGKNLGGGTLASPNATPTPNTCPDGSAPDANGNCPTSTTNQLQSQPFTNGHSNNNNNNPKSSHHHKGSSTDLGQTGGGGGESSLTAKKGKSPTPPACPETGPEPIPPNCTKKPTF